jgi:two-component system response regulator PilR (NtrC family)
MTASILVVDDMVGMQRVLNGSLASEGYRVATAGSGEEALARIETQDFDLIVTDIVMPGLSGLDVLEKAQLLNPRAVVIVMTAYATLETAVTALRRGACDYLEKPVSLDELNLRVRRALEQRDATLRARLQQRALLRSPIGDAIIGESKVMLVLFEQIARSARTPSNVLVTGESGVGKELVARAIHGASARCDGAFIAVNCGAIPEALLESQLFGHVRGAFTTAVQSNPGLFMAANGGTLLLDEIGDLPFSLQVKLLRVIEERHVWPVGATRPVPVDVRIVASTNRDLAAEVQAGRFREDLFYRLNVVHLKVPPLRERRSDIPLLVDRIIARLNAKLGTQVLGIERDALWELTNREWKGNVRELENVLERAIVLGSGDLIALQPQPSDATAAGDAQPRNLRQALRRFERQHLLSVIAEAGSDKREAARRLGISLASVYRKLSATTDDDA